VLSVGEGVMLASAARGGGICYLVVLVRCLPAQHLHTVPGAFFIYIYFVRFEIVCYGSIAVLYGLKH
jgi:hypothetical protein